MTEEIREERRSEAADAGGKFSRGHFRCRSSALRSEELLLSHAEPSEWTGSA